jgi:hypothetical protein
MIDLKDVTIVSVTGVNSKSHLQAIKYSSRYINYAAKKLITSEDIQDDDVEVIKIGAMDYVEYSRFLVYDLGDHIDTTHALIVQSDGYVVNPDMWKDEFLEYDYIGAPWPLPMDDFSFRDPEGNIQRVGNGGFSLRSTKLLKLAKQLNLEWKQYFGFYNEDGFYTCHNRKIYENNGCKYAPIEIASQFSQEIHIPENEGIIPFGFHGKNHFYYAITQKNFK